MTPLKPTINALSLMTHAGKRPQSLQGAAQFILEERPRKNVPVTFFCLCAPCKSACVP